MGIDLFLLAVIVVFGLLGMLTGAARQIAQLAALVVAYAVAGPLGARLGPAMARWLGGAPLAAGAVAATVTVFLAVMIGLRYALTLVLRRAMAGKDPEDRTVDRNLGMFFAAFKVTALAYVVLCALVFAERNVTAFGRSLGVSPRDSIAFDIARRYNLFELTQFSAVRDLMAVATAAADPERAKKLAQDPAFAALRKDPRWQKAMSDREIREAIEKGDSQALLRSNAVLKLLQDTALTGTLADAAAAAAAE